MSDLFENLFGDQPLDPSEAARRNMRALRRRFYQKAAAREVEGAFAVELDGRPLRTPGRRRLAFPSRVLAEQAAAEWNAQADVVNPALTPLTRLANTVIDGLADAGAEARREARAAAAADIAKYLGTDLLVYRAQGPDRLVGRQNAAWNPFLAWARDAHGARFILAEGVTFATQPEGAVAAMQRLIPADPWRLGAAHVATTLTGSALLALALAEGATSPDEVWTAAHVDEDWNMELWGRDDEALARRAARRAEFDAAARVLALVPAGAR